MSLNACMNTQHTHLPTFTVQSYTVAISARTIHPPRNFSNWRHGHCSWNLIQLPDITDQSEQPELCNHVGVDDMQHHAVFPSFVSSVMCLRRSQLSHHHPIGPARLPTDQVSMGGRVYLGSNHVLENQFITAYCLLYLPSFSLPNQCMLLYCCIVSFPFNFTTTRSFLPQPTGAPSLTFRCPSHYPVLCPYLAIIIQSCLQRGWTICPPTVI